ncbi:hypothetical protein ACJMK2_029614 [Sinanodonta woodiana]|uniref:Uncharacterized protein n=1 Tax=Sinanodonta woodiana TaxID=1069815 RepID=A0ABD3XB67_SINWO
MKKITAFNSFLMTLFILTTTGTDGMTNTKECIALGGGCVDSRVVRCMAIDHDACSSLGIDFAACCYNPHLVGK